MLRSFMYAMSGSTAMTRSARGLVAFVLLCLVAPCVSLATPNISVTAGRLQLTSGGTYEFGRSFQGRGLTRTISIRNLGTSALEELSVTAPEPYVITFEPPATVAPRRGTVVRVTLPAAAAPGAATGELVIRSNDPTRGTITIDLTGEVVPVAPDISVSLSGSALNPNDTIDFGSTLQGIALSRALTITNTGNANLVVSRIRSSDATFTVSFRRAVTLRPGRRLSVPLRVPATSGRTGITEGNLVITCNDPDAEESSFTLPMRVDIQRAPGGGILVFDGGRPVVGGAEISYGRFASRAVTKTFTVRNSSRATVDLGQVMVEGSGFRVTTQPLTPLRAGRGTRFSVQLLAETPSAAPRAVVTLPIGDEEDDDFSFNVFAEFTQVGPDISLRAGGSELATTATIDLGTIFVRDSISTSIGVSNSGTAPVTISGSMVSGTGFMLTSNPDGSINPNATGRAATVTYTAGNNTGTFSGTLTLSTSDPDKPAYSITFNVTVAAPPSGAEILFARLDQPDPLAPAIPTSLPSGSSFNFPTIEQNANFPQSFAVYNIGTTDLVIDPAIMNPVPGSIELTWIRPQNPVFPLIVPPGGTPGTPSAQFIEFQVTLRGATPGNFNGQLSIAHNDTDDNENPYLINFSGSVLVPSGMLRVTRVVSGVETQVLRTPTETISFGTDRLGQTPTPITFTLTNDSSVFDLSTVSVFIPNAGFVLTQPPQATIPALGSTTMSVALNAATAGDKSAMIEIRSSDSLGAFIFDARGTVNNWFPVGGAVGDMTPRPSGEVRALLDLDIDGTGGGGPNHIYAGGAFTTLTTSGTVVNRIARFTPGGAWAALGTGLNGTVNALASWDADNDPANGALLVAGGEFTTAGGAPANRVAIWNGATWAALGTGTSGTVRALCEYDEDRDGPNPPRLFIGGQFDTAGGVTVNNIARWDGTAFTAIGPVGNVGVGPTPAAMINAFAVFDPDFAGPLPRTLFVGGLFNRAGAIANANHVAQWNGTEFLALSGGGSNGVTGGAMTMVNAFTVYDPDASGNSDVPALVIAGQFSQGGNVAGSNIIRYGRIPQTNPAIQGFRSVSAGTVNGPINAVAVFDEGGALADTLIPPALYIGGSFTSAFGANAGNAARFNGSAWTSLASPSNTGLNAPVLAFNNYSTVTTSNNPALSRLITGGTFTTANAQNILNIAAWGVAGP